MPTGKIAEILDYMKSFPEESARLPFLMSQIKQGRDLFTRTNFEGHVTASALIFNTDMAKVLFIHHKSLDRWLQPGGHVEDDATLWEAALREAREETGVIDIQPHTWHAQNDGIPFDIDTHDIPARPQKNEPVHKHHDCLFIAVAEENAATALQLEEVNAAEWKTLRAFDTEPRLVRVREKLKACGLI